MIYSAESTITGSKWLKEHGPRELEQLFRSIVYYPSAPILIADDDGSYQDASVGAAKLLGLPRVKVIGQNLNEFAEPSSKTQISQLWQAFLAQGEQAGSLRLLSADGSVREVEFVAKGNVLPVRHVLALRDKSATQARGQDSTDEIPAWVKDFALYLLDTEGRIVAWYSGAERIYGFGTEDVMSHHISTLCPDENYAREKRADEVMRAAIEGHVGLEGWRARKDGSRFWANVILLALKDENDVLQGFAGVTRDFTERHEQDVKLQRSRGSMRSIATHSTVAGIVSGEYDGVPEANDAFLEMVGYTREDLNAGLMHWPDLTPEKYAALDELAHEEGLRFGACTPYEKELIRKDNTRIWVLVATAVLKVSPYRWISFIQDLRDRDLNESVADDSDGIELKQNFEEIVGSSVALRRVQQQIEVVAPTDATVLILGETGTGKELVARAIHRMSPRNKLPFITLNCAAIPTGLLESELFGYERGAFTGALTQKIGRFEMAHKGTLFLDEVGDIPIDLQPKLLRALQEKSFERLGGTKTIPIDVRLVAATNRNLTQMMGDKMFRSDLYYRLKVFPITTPPLRDRPEDIPMLARHFTKKYSAKMGREVEKIPADTMKVLVDWRWPGNIRELENFIERAVILSTGSNLRAPLDEIKDGALPNADHLTLEQVERDHIIKALRDCDGVVTKAATRLGLHRTTLNAMMGKLGISRKDM